MKAKYTTRFPCGYETTIELWSLINFLFMYISNSDFTENDLCPLHGKNCKKGD